MLESERGEREQEREREKERVKERKRESRERGEREQDNDSALVHNPETAAASLHIHYAHALLEHRGSIIMHSLDAKLWAGCARVSHPRLLLAHSPIQRARRARLANYRENELHSGALPHACMTIRVE